MLKNQATTKSVLMTKFS